MTHPKSKLFKIGGSILVAGIIIGVATALYLFNLPHRAIEDAKVDYQINATQIVEEFLSAPSQANDKYLAADGDSKIFEIQGTLKDISEGFEGTKILLIQDNASSAGVSAFFSPESSQQFKDLQVGQQVTIKGVIRSGASYDEDLEMYEHVILEKSILIQK